MNKPVKPVGKLSVERDPVAQSFAVQSKPSLEAHALIDILTKCNVKLESEPEGHRLYWNGGEWVVSNGTKLQDFPKSSDAIIAFTQQLYT